MKPIAIKKNVRKGECQASGCRNKTHGSKLCSTCRCRKSRLADPYKYAYNNLKNRAKQRGILFTITPEQFREFCIKTKYIDYKDRESDGLTIDRIHNGLGYHLDNIRVLTKRDNVVKYIRYDSRLKKAVEAVIEEPEFDKEDLPF